MRKCSSFDYTGTDYITLGDADGLRWLNTRAKSIVIDNAEFIIGKRVVDLAGRDGHLSYPCLSVGAEHVVCVEARQDSIDHGKAHIKDTEYEKRLIFQKSDLFDFLASTSPGQFDVIMCLGFLYHTTRQVDFFRECGRLRPETILIDTSVAKKYFWFGRKLFGHPPALFMMPGYEDPKLPQNTIETDGVVYWPSISFIEDMLSRIGYNYKRIKFPKSSGSLKVYNQGIRAAWIAHL